MPTSQLRTNFEGRTNSFGRISREKEYTNVIRFRGRGEIAFKYIVCVHLLHKKCLRLRLIGGLRQVLISRLINS